MLWVPETNQMVCVVSSDFKIILFKVFHHENIYLFFEALLESSKEFGDIDFYLKF